MNKLLEVVLHVGKGATFGVQKVNGGQNICCRYVSVGNGKNFEKQAQPSKAMYYLICQPIPFICCHDQYQYNYYREENFLRPR